MARIRAFSAIDMSDTASQIGEVTYADEEVVVIEGEESSSFYFGDFTYPDDGWNGTIKRIQNYDSSGTLTGDIRGFELDTRFATVGTTALEAAQKVLEGDDRIVGSRDGDVLIGFSGNDAIRGGLGDDVLQGRRGVDVLSGGVGDDRLRGGLYKDTLTGGRGDDALHGDEGRDVFVFGERDGSDVIRDFQNRRDKIQIEDGADDFRDLEITETGSDVLVAFARTDIVLRDVDAEDLGRGDFLFV